MLPAPARAGKELVPLPGKISSKVREMCLGDLETVCICKMRLHKALFMFAWVTSKSYHQVKHSTLVKSECSSQKIRALSCYQNLPLG